MTKVTILGQSQGEEPKKKIEFVKRIGTGDFGEPQTKPEEYENIELVCTGYVSYDGMYGYNDDRDSGVLYLGHFNDGIV